MLYNMGKVHKAACPSVQFKVDSRVFKHQLIIVSCLVVLCAKALVGAFIISKKALFPFSNIVKTTGCLKKNGILWKNGHNYLNLLTEKMKPKVANPPSKNQQNSLLTLCTSLMILCISMTCNESNVPHVGTR